MGAAEACVALAAIVQRSAIRADGHSEVFCLTRLGEIAIRNGAVPFTPGPAPCVMRPMGVGSDAGCPQRRWATWFPLWGPTASMMELG